jgi:hypothetical protein
VLDIYLFNCDTANFFFFNFGKWLHSSSSFLPPSSLLSISSSPPSGRTTTSNHFSKQSFPSSKQYYNVKKKKVILNWNRILVFRFKISKFYNIQIWWNLIQISNIKNILNLFSLSVILGPNNFSLTVMSN